MKTVKWVLHLHLCLCEGENVQTVFALIDLQFTLLQANSMQMLAFMWHS